MLRIAAFFLKRFLLSDKRLWLRPDSVFMALGIILSVATLMVGFALFNGYERALKDIILGANSHAYIFKSGYSDLTGDDLAVLDDMLKGDPNIVAHAPMVSTPAMALHKDRYTGILLRGIDTRVSPATTDFKRFVRNGSAVITDPHQAVVGSRLARELGVGIGDTLQILSPLRMKFSLMGMTPTKRYLTVVGLYESGMYQYDSEFLFVSLDTARDFMPNRGEYSWVEIKVKPEWIDRADELVAGWNARQLGEYRFVSWKYHHASLFELLTLEKWAIFIIFSFLVEIATFNVISAVSTSILEKSREIGILRAVGTPVASLKAVFLGQAMFVAGLAVILGEILGYGAAKLISVQTLYRLKGEVYFMEDIHVGFGWQSWVLIFVIAWLLVLVAGLIPLRRIGRMDVAAIVRGE